MLRDFKVGWRIVPETRTLLITKGDELLIPLLLIVNSLSLYLSVPYRRDDEGTGYSTSQGSPKPQAG